MIRQLALRLAVVHAVILSSVLSGFGQNFPEIIWDKEAQAPMYPGTSSNSSIRFSHDGQLVFAGGSRRYGNEVGSITTFAAADGSILKLTPTFFPIHGINELALSPDGLRLVTAHNGVSCTSTLQDECRYGYILYETQELAVISAPLTSRYPASSVDYSPDGGLIAIGDFAPADNIKLLRAKDFSVAGTLPGHTRAPGNGWTQSVRFSPDGQFLASAGNDFTVKIWRVSDGALVQTLAYGSEVVSIEFSPDGQFIAAADRANSSKIKVFQLKDGEVVRTFENPTFGSTVRHTVRWTPDGQYVVNAVVSGFDPSQIRFWNFDKGELARTFVGSSVNNAIRTLQFSPDGLTFAFGYGSHVILARNPFPPSNAGLP